MIENEDISFSVQFNKISKKTVSFIKYNQERILEDAFD